MYRTDGRPALTRRRRGMRIWRQHCIYCLQKGEDQEDKGCKNWESSPWCVTIINLQSTYIFLFAAAPKSFAVLFHIIAEIPVVELIDCGVFVKLIEELRSILSTQPVDYYPFFTENIHIRARIDEVTHQNRIGCYPVLATVKALLVGYEVPEQRFCLLVDCHWRNCENPVFELYVQYAACAPLFEFNASI